LTDFIFRFSFSGSIGFSAAFMDVSSNRTRGGWQMSQFPGKAYGPWKREVNKQFCEPVSKRSRSVKIKAGDYFNRRHTYRMSRIEMGRPTPILTEMGPFGIGSHYSISMNASHLV
jgi:hypothetical protein